MSQATVNPPRSPAYCPLVTIVSAVAAGILIDQLLGGSVQFAALYASMGLGAVGLATGIYLGSRGKCRTSCLCLLIATASCAAAWHHESWFLFGDDDLSLFTRPGRQPVCIEGVALETPRLTLQQSEKDPLRSSFTGDRLRLLVQVSLIRDGDGWRSASGRAWMEIDASESDLEAGDTFRSFARLLPVQNALNPGQFDVALNERARGVDCVLRVVRPESISKLSDGAWYSPRRWFERIRTAGNRLFAKYLHDQDAALASAILLGIRDQLEPSETELFQETGTIHLLVIAGLHLGILAGAAMFFFRRLPWSRAKALTATALFAIGYMFVVDAQPPIVRATVLILGTCAAIYFGRRRISFNILALAGLIVLVRNPSDLFLAGPQLSFLCVAALMWLSPRWFGGPIADADRSIQKLLEANRPWYERAMRSLLQRVWHFGVVSLAVWIVTTPLVMARFNVFNPIAIPVNTAAWIPLAVALISGLGILVTGVLCPWITPPFVFCCHWSLAALHGLIHLGQQMPGGHMRVPGPPDWWMLVFYSGLGVLAAFPAVRPPRRWCWALLSAWIAVGFISSWATDRQGLRCTVLAVGHGEAVVLELPNGKTMLCDAGQFSAPTAACRTISGYLWSRGITHIDAVVLSHSDIDHYNGLPGLFSRFSVGVVYVSGVMFMRDNAALRFLHKSIDDAGVPLMEVSTGDTLSGGPDCRIEVLHPPSRGVIGTENANSIVLNIEYCGRRILITGDLASPGMDDVIAESPMHCDLLVVPHHGSKTSNPLGLSAWCTPDYAVFSADHRYDTRSVEAIYARRGRTLHTADVGAVTMTVGPKGKHVETFLRPGVNVEPLMFEEAAVEP